MFFCDSPQAVPKTLTSLLKRQLGKFEWLVKTYSDSQLLEQQWKELGGALSRATVRATVRATQEATVRATGLAIAGET